MRNTTRRYIAAFMAVVMSISLSFGLRLSAQAAGNVDYVYAGTYIKNWGIRGELATFLSPNAEEFYDDNNITLDELLALDGSSNEENVSSSALYKKLQSIMKSNHSYITSYDATRQLFQYTDCQNSGKTSSKISSFYSGKEIGPSWDSGSTWNREHTWPNSKGDAAGNGENDIMMLRPTASSENGSRGNKAYGESSSYYNPNTESSGKYDLRGDVARIILYQYVRWACTNTGSKYNPNGIFGTNGVFESKEVLLKWMEDDPVDTWELGRNDSVESITGTRNVFVDYPELAFDLFNEEVPSDYKTPSSSTTSSGYKITATSNNTAWGTVSVNKNTVFATSKNGYEAVDFTIVSGNATVERTGDEFVLDTNGNVTIQINFAPIKTVTFVEDGASARTMNKYQNGTIALPSHKTAIKMGYTFLGWSAAAVKDTDKKPAFLNVGDDYKVSEDATLYALYSKKQDNKVVYFTSTSTTSTPSTENSSSKNEQSVSSNPANNTTSSKPSGSTASKNEQSTSDTPTSNTSSKGEQTASSNPIGNTSSNDKLNVDSESISENEQDLTDIQENSVIVDLSESAIVKADLFESAADKQVPLVLQAESYTWNFEKLLFSDDDKVKDFDATIYVGDEVSEGHKSIIKDAAKGKSFLPISFAHSGTLPAKATVTINVDEALAGREVEVYSVTEGGSAVLECKITVSDNATLSFKTERTSLYFVTESVSDNDASLLWLWIVIAIALAGGAVVVFILYKKKIIFEKV